MINFNFHQHSIYSDGAEVPEQYVQSAIDLGFSAIGFTEHSPLPFDNPFSLKSDNIEKYVNTIDSLRNAYGDVINIYRALEMDFIPGMSEDFNHWIETCKTDYLIGSVHLVLPPETGELWFTDGPDYKIYDDGLHKFFDGDIRKAVKTYFNQINTMIETQDFEILGHMDKISMHNQDRFFTQDEKWYQLLIDETLDQVKQKDLIVEVNTRGKYKKRSDYLFPDGLALKKVSDMKIPVIISSDAHKPDELNKGFDDAVQQLIAYGISEVWRFDNGQWISEPLR